jgi:hypothetical protein
LDDGQQQVDRLFAFATDGLMDCRERGIHVLGEVDIVEPDDTTSPGCSVEIVQRAHRADRHGIAHSQDRRGADAVSHGR